VCFDCYGSTREQSACQCSWFSVSLVNVGGILRISSFGRWPLAPNIFTDLAKEMRSAGSISATASPAGRALRKSPCMVHGMGRIH